MISPEEFLQTLNLRGSNDRRFNATFKLGKIPADYTAGHPRVIFDGESTAADITYRHLGSYSPAGNDRVLLAAIGNTWVILGKII